MFIFKKNKNKVNNVVSLKEYKKLRNSKPYIIYDYYYNDKKRNLLTNKDIYDFEKLLKAYREVREYILKHNIDNKEQSRLLIEMSHYLLELKHNEDVNIYIDTLMDYKREVLKYLKNPWARI